MLIGIRLIEHPFEALAIAVSLASIPFAGLAGVAGAVGTGATGSVLGGLGAAGIAFLGRRLALRFFPRIAAFVAGRIPLPPWAARFLPLGMEGGFTASAEQGWFDFIRDGRVNWKKALISAVLGTAIGFGTPFVMDGIGLGLKQIRHLPVAFDVTPDGAVLTKRLGDTGFGQKLEEAGDSLRRFAGSGDATGTIPHSRNHLLKSVEPPAQNTDEAYESYFETILGKRLKRVKGTDLALPDTPVNIPGDILGQWIRDGRVKSGNSRKLENYVKNYDTKTIQLGKDLIVIIDKNTMKHILEGHHPKYFNPKSRYNYKQGKVTSIKPTTLFPSNMTEREVEQVLIQILHKKKDMIYREASEAGMYRFQFGDEKEVIADGIKYVVGFSKETVKNGIRYRRVGQFYPKVDLPNNN